GDLGGVDGDDRGVGRHGRHDVGLRLELAVHGVVMDGRQQHLDGHSSLRAELPVEEDVGEAAGTEQLLVLVTRQLRWWRGRPGAHTGSVSTSWISFPMSIWAQTVSITPARVRSRTGSIPGRSRVVPLVVPMSRATTCLPSSRSSRWEREMSCWGLGTVISCGTSWPLNREARGRNPTIAIRSNTKLAHEDVSTVCSDGRMHVLD